MMYVCTGWGDCLYTGMRKPQCTPGGQRTVAGGQFPLSAFLRQGFSVSAVTGFPGQLVHELWGGLSCLHLCLTLGVLGLQMHATSPASFCGCCQAPMEMLCLFGRLAGPIFIFSFVWGANAGFVSV